MYIRRTRFSGLPPTSFLLIPLFPFLSYQASTSDCFLLNPEPPGGCGQAACGAGRPGPSVDVCTQQGSWPWLLHGAWGHRLGGHSRGEAGSQGLQKAGLRPVVFAPCLHCGASPKSMGCLAGSFFPVFPSMLYGALKLFFVSWP